MAALSVRLIALIGLGALGAALLTGCGASPGPGGDAEPRIVTVPGDASTAQAGADLLRPGDVLLLGAGVYREELVVQTPDVTIRGEDRNEVVFDGGGTLSQGILVIADGVRVQNLTVHSYLYNGVLVTGMHDGADALAHGVGGYDRLDPAQYPPLQRYAIEYVTAYNNGLYGLYAFNAQHGSITDSYVSGSADSGIYVGQCEDCDVVVTGNVAEGNAIGFENANASAPISITGNRFVGNRVGMTLISHYQEAFAPQRGNVVAGNVIAHNANPESPAQADGGYGIGVGIAGGQGNLLTANLIVGNPAAGVLLRNTEDIPVIDTRIEANEFAENAVDVLESSSSLTPARGNCVTDPPGANVVPVALSDPACAELSTTPVTPTFPAAPPGTSFLRLPAPIDQPQLPDIDTIPTALPDRVSHPDATSLAVPSPTLLLDRTRR